MTGSAIAAERGISSRMSTTSNARKASKPPTGSVPGGTSTPNQSSSAIEAISTIAERPGEHLAGVELADVHSARSYPLSRRGVY